MTAGRRPPRPPTHRSWDARTPAVALCGVLLAALTAVVVRADDVPGDVAVARALLVAPEGPWHDVARVVSAFTDTLVLVVVAAVVGAALAVARRVPEGALVVAGTVVAVLLTAALKRAVERPRPDLATVAASELSRSAYPSGHAAGTAALGLSAVVVALGTRWLRHVVVAALALVGVVAWSQLALAVHSPSDLVGGWLAAAVCVGVARWATGVRARQGSNLRPSA